jgi:hypothetical protein
MCSKKKQGEPGTGWKEKEEEEAFWGPQENSKIT